MKKGKILKLLCLAMFSIVMAFCSVACLNPSESTSSEPTTSEQESTTQSGGELEQATIVLSQTEVIMTEYDTFALSARMSDNSEATFTWESSATDIVTVDGGLLTALKEGSAVITVSAGSLSATCAVTVEKSSYYPAMVLSQDTAKVKSGEYITAYADVTFMGQSVSDMPVVTWTAEDPSIVKVEQEGAYVKLTALAVGKTNVIVSATYRGMALEKVLVFESVSADVFSLREEEIDVYTFEHGDMSTTYALTGLLNGETELPEGATLSFASEDDSIASVSAEGVVSKVSVGATRITATYTCGSVTLQDTCIVNVKLTQIALDKSFDIYLDSQDGDQTFDFAELGIASGNYAWAFVDGAEPVAIDASVDGDNVTLALTMADCGERKVQLLKEGEVAYTFNIVAITKVIDTAEELLQVTTYGVIENVRNDMPEHGQWWKGPFNYWEQKAYLVLGADIVLPADASFNNRYAYANDGETLVANGGLIGGFDGRGYTISGGTYNWGGLLGNIPAGTIVKNVAFVNANIGGDFSAIIAITNYGTIENVLIDCIKDGAGSVNGSVAAVNNGTVRNSVVYWPMPVQAGRNGAIAYVVGATSVVENCILFTENEIAGATGAGHTVTGVVKLPLDTVWSEIELPASVDATLWDLTGKKAGFKSYANYMASVYAAIADVNLDTGASVNMVLPYLTAFEIVSTTDQAMMQYVTYDGATLAISNDATKSFSFVIALTYNGTAVTDEVTISVKAPAMKLNKTVDLYLNANDGDTVIEIASDLGLDVAVSESTVYTARFTGTEDFLTVTATEKGLTFPVTADMAGEKGIVITIDGMEVQFSVAIITKAIKTAEELINIKSFGIVTDEGTCSRDNAPVWKLNGYFTLANNIDLTGYTVGVNFSYAPWAAPQGGTNWGLIGTFDGRNYTLFGGTYTNGGIFGCVGDGGIVKNVAIVNASLVGDRKGVFAKEIRNCLIENVLVDLVSVNLSNGGALGSLLSAVTLRNVVIYYPADATGTNGALANNVDITAENAYVISDKVLSGSTNKVAGTLVQKAAGTACADVGFEGLGDNWVLTGDKATFASTVAVANEYLKTIEMPSAVKAGESLTLTLPSIVSFSFANFSVDGAEEFVSANGSIVVVSGDASEGFTFDIVLTSVYGGSRAVTITVDAEKQYVNAGYYTFSLYEQQDATYNFGAGVNGTVQIAIGEEVVGLPVVDGALTVAYAQVSSLLGEYSFVLESGSKVFVGTFVVATKVIKTAEELINIKSFGTVTDEGTCSRDNAPVWKLNGYFALGNNIDLTGYTVGVNFSYAPWAATGGGTNWGLIGTFNGCNYTLYGGTYADGGIFGCVGDGAVVKNVAIVNATLAGDRKGVFAKEIRNCLIENVLVDLASVSLSNGGALGSLLYNVTLRNVVIYYPADATGTNGALANYVEISAENAYVISDKVLSGSTNKVAGTLVQKAAGTACADVGFTGLSDNWVLTGNKAIFKSTQEFLA